ncbi:hypothetical protein C4569_00575 [Candidatus Parcubacteria bacterium]|nr:MAG: hypothetical protein C4569_00575 [Candidatus Parcubacteria bacterium]
MIRPKKIKKGSLFIKIFSSGLAVFIVSVVFVSFLKNYLESRKVDNQIRMIEYEISRIETENAKISELIKYFDSQAYAEQIARSQFSMQKEGEEVVVINDGDTGTVNQDKKNNKLETELSNPQKWLRYFLIKK